MNSYFNFWINFWLPIYKRQIFKARFNKDTDTLLSIKENIYKNIHFNREEKVEILKQLNIYKVC